MQLDVEKMADILSRQDSISDLNVQEMRDEQLFYEIMFHWSSTECASKAEPQRYVRLLDYLDELTEHLDELTEQMEEVAEAGNTLESMLSDIRRIKTKRRLL